MSNSSDYLRSFFQDNNLFVPEEPTDKLENIKNDKENKEEEKSITPSEKIIINASKESKEYSNQKEINLRKLFWALETEEKQFIKEARKERKEGIKKIQMSYSLATWQQIMKNVFCQWTEQAFPVLQETIKKQKEPSFFFTPKKGRPKKREKKVFSEIIDQEKEITLHNVHIRTSRGSQEYLPEIQNPFPKEKDILSEDSIYQNERDTNEDIEDIEPKKINNDIFQETQPSSSFYRIKRDAKNKYREESSWQNASESISVLKNTIDKLDTIASKTQESINLGVEILNNSLNKKSQEVGQSFQKTKEYIFQKKASISESLNTKIKAFQEEQRKKREKKVQLQQEEKEQQKRKKIEALLQKQKEEQIKKEQEEKLLFEHEERKKIEKIIEEEKALIKKEKDHNEKVILKIKNQYIQTKEKNERDQKNNEEDTHKEECKNEKVNNEFFFSFQVPKIISQHKRWKDIKEVIHIGSMVLGVFLIGTAGLSLPGWMQQYEYIWNADVFMERQESLNSLVAQQKLQTLPIAGKESSDKYYNENIIITPPDTRIVIPKIAQNIPIVFAGENARQKEDWSLLEKEIQKGLQDGVVHYPGTAIPGENGNVFITGHSSYYAWDKGRYKDAFAPLHNLEVGDNYFIYHKGIKHSYKIIERKIVPPSDTSVLDQNPNKKESTLMTCTPIGTAKNRLILKSEEITSQ